MNPSRSIDWRVKVFDSLSYPTLVLTPERIIVSANQKVLDKLGVDEEELVGKSCREVFRRYFLDDHLPCSRSSCPLDQTLQSGTGHSTLHEVMGRDGRLRWEDRVFSPILDDNGQAVYVIESIRDVTRTKRLEQMIHGIGEFLDRVIQSSVSAIVAADRGGSVMLMNQAAEALFGHQFKTADRLNIASLYPEGVAQDIMEKLRDDRVGGRGKLPVTRVTVRTAGGDDIPVEMTGAIIYEGDQELATMGIYNDLRERIAATEKLQEAHEQVVQSEKMASLGRLAAGVAHEINNPLTGIIMYSHLMMEKIGEDDPFRSQLSYILEDAGRCKDIVRNLLAYSRQDSVTREIFSLNVLVDESLRLIRDQQLFAKVAVQRVYSKQPVQVMADRNKMCQVVINLVINAVDAMEKQGRLTLATYVVEADQLACLEVVDTGPGIKDQDQARIFEPFFTTKPPGSGTGLGLSTAYGIVQKNGGDIRIKKTGPEGTVFSVTLPLVAENTSAMPESIG